MENPKNQAPEQPPTPPTPNAEAQAPAKDSIVDVEEEPMTPAQENQRKRRALALLEAALYVAGRPLNANELGQVINSRSKKRILGYIDALMEEYQHRSRALEIIALKDERFVLQVKAEFTPLIKKLVNRPLLSSGPLKTLSYIAYRQPITQKRVIDVRGQHAYGHVKLLKDMGLIVTERSGRSLALKTTDYFADYFGLTQDTVLLKKDLRRIFGDAIKEDALERRQKEAEQRQEQPEKQ